MLGLIKPMLAATATEPFDSNDYFFEVKWDGIRCLAFIDAGGVRLQSRRLSEITAQFPELGSLRSIPNGTVLDGELIILESGKPSLLRIQQRMHLQDRVRVHLLSELSPAVFMVFDVLYAHGKSVMMQSLACRRHILAYLLCELDGANVKMTEGVLGAGIEYFAAVQRMGLEGVMAKRLDGRYLVGRRSGNWKKIKTLGIRMQWSDVLRCRPVSNGKSRR